MVMKVKVIVCALALMAVLSAQVKADLIPYPTPGVVNPVIYSFTAAATGDLSAYFAGSTAAFTNVLGLLVNGVDTGIYGLNNHTSPLGTKLDFGPVTAGDKLVFVLENLVGLIPPGQKAFSDPTLNGPYDSPAAAINHVYSTPYTGTGPIIDSIPAGTFVSFEDLKGGGDLNYNDEDFVFTNVAAVGTPEPATLSLACLGIASLCGYKWRKRKTVVA